MQNALQAKLEGYSDRIKEYFSEKKPPPLPQQQILKSTKTTSPREPLRFELYPPETPPKSTPTRRIVQEERSLPKRQLIRPSKPRAYKLPSILSFDKQRGYIQGIIMSEILGPPVSKRRRRGRGGFR